MQINVTSALKHSKKQGELSLTISVAADHKFGCKKVQKLGKIEHHLWKKRESVGSGQKALNHIRTASFDKFLWLITIVCSLKGRILT
ncbi:hypothetical protein P3L10_005274 [Capsicum annuum]